MGQRVYIDKQSPSIFRALAATSAEIRARAEAVGLPRTTIELVNVRVSQLNACVYCLDPHTQLAIEAGESVRRLAVLPGWRETTLFTPAERAALTIAETVSQVTGAHLDDAYAELREVLTDDELSVLIWAAVSINAFNRVSILSRHPVRPGT